MGRNDANSGEDRKEDPPMIQSDMETQEHTRNVKKTKTRIEPMTRCAVRGIGHIHVHCVRWEPR